MRYKDCSHCGKIAIPVNETITVDNESFCIACYEDLFLQEKGKLDGKKVEKNKDPTVCTNCAKDNGEIEFTKLSVYPFCDDCLVKVKNRTFPAWVQAFFVVLGLIVVASFLFNFKYYRGYRQLNEATLAVASRGDYATAAALMKRASNNVPEAVDLKTMASYFNGINLLIQDKSEEALKEFYACQFKLPDTYGLPTLILHAQAGVAFDKKDYRGYLDAAKQSLALDTTSATSWISVASAYSCLYAESGEDSLKIRSGENLAHARLIDDTSAGVKNYYDMVEYRIANKSTIRRQDFEKQFPNGWNKN